MTVWAISDLHLPAKIKPMDIFGPQWLNHFERIREDWNQNVSDEDIVLLPGDLSWAMHLEEAADDLARLGELPGRKILIRGNHDFWWNSIGRVRRALPANCYALQNDSIQLDGILFAGSRGWQIPYDEQEDTDDARIFRRERQRLEMSLKDARNKSEDAPLVVLLHYPPMTESLTGFSDILAQYNVHTVVYGHLHGAGLGTALNGKIGDITYYQVSCDGLKFRLAHIPV